MKAVNNELVRYDDNARMNHWMVALLFFLATLSGLALFHPALFFLTNLFGGGPWNRILHPYFGVVMFLCFIGMFVRLWRDNVLNHQDRVWLQHSSALLKGDKTAMPPVGKYNGGQKLVFWLMVASLVVLMVTGLLFWQAWFPAMPVAARRIGVLLHAVSALVLVLTVIVHIYAAIWVKGTIRAMTRGTVTPGWARTNHPLWHEEVGRK